MQRLVECAKQELNLVYLELNWEDVLSYNIQEEDLVKCVQFIHQARSNGGSVLVHCAHVSVKNQVPSLVPRLFFSMLHAEKPWDKVAKFQLER